MLNLITLVGRLTKDPELRKMAETDKSFVNFAVAFDSPTTDEAGERNTTFLDAIAFDQRAELIANNLHKGSKVALSGSLNQRDFLRKDGTKGRVYEIFVNTIEFLDPKPVSEEQQAEQEVAEVVDENLPFNGEEAKPQEKPTPKFDPYTGKPLTKPAKKK